MFKDSVDAYVREDVELGRARLCPRDKQLDELNRVVSRQINPANGAGPRPTCAGI